jgi:ABC-type amino acid transport substrate-binding protein
MQEQILRIGLDFSAPIPLHTDYSSGDFKGFEVDLVNEIANELELKLEYSVSYWKNIIQDLKDNKIDIICSAGTFSHARAKELSFSKPYLDFHLCTVYNKTNLFSFNELKNKKIGVRIETEAEEYLKKFYPEAKLETFDTNNAIYESLSQMKIDVLIDDSPIAFGLLKQNPKLVIGEYLPNSESQYAIIMKKENVDLKRKIDAILEKLENNSFLKNNKLKWFDQFQP